jgi:hypothetical protein
MKRIATSNDVSVTYPIAAVGDGLLLAVSTPTMTGNVGHVAETKPPFVAPGGLAGLGPLQLFQARFGRLVAGGGRQEADASSGTSFIEISNMSERQAGV